jgi:hypothetical protein
MYFIKSKRKMNLNQQSPLRSVSLLLFLLLFISGSVSAQSWCLRKDPSGINVKPHELTKTDDNKLFVVGVATSGSYLDNQIYYGKFLKNSGNSYQNRIDVTEYSDGLSNATKGPDNTMVVVGYAGHRYTRYQREYYDLPLCTNQAKMYVAKIDNATGGVIWQRTLNKGCDDYGYDIVRSNITGEYAVLGNHYSSAPDVFNIYLVFMNENGTALREKSIRSNTGKSLYARRILNTSDGGFLILAQEGTQTNHPYQKSSYYANYTGEATLVIRLDANANIVWQKRISPVFSNCDVVASDMLQNGAGDIFVTGTADFKDVFDYGYLIKLDNAGNWVDDLMFRVNAPSSSATVSQSLLREGNTLYVSGYTFYGTAINKFLLTFDANSFALGSSTRYLGGAATGSMRNTVGSTTTIFLSGGEDVFGSEIDLIKNQIGSTGCCESSPTVNLIDDVTNFENASLTATQFVLTDPQTPDVDPIAITFYTEDLCSSSKTSNSISLEEELVPSIYPNPASDRVNIVTMGESATTLYIHNAQGQLILSRELQPGDNTFDTSGLESGIYFLEMRSQAKVHTEKLLIQH